MTLIEKDIAARPYDVEAIRRDFPALSLEVHGKPLVYLDNAASAQKPKAMLDALMKSYTKNMRTSTAAFIISPIAATAAYEGGRERVAKFLNAPSHEQIIFTKNATEAINLAAQSFGGLHIGPGDEIVLTIMEHHSNIVPWHFHRERARRHQMGAGDGRREFRLWTFEAAITPRTKIGFLADHADVERARHDHAGEGGLQDTPTPTAHMCSSMYGAGVGRLPVLPVGMASHVSCPWAIRLIWGRPISSAPLHPSPGH